MSVGEKRSGQISCISQPEYGYKHALKVEQTDILTVGQKQNRCVGALLGRDVCVQSRVMCYISIHDIASTFKGMPSDFDIKRSMTSQLSKPNSRVFHTPWR